MIKRGQDFCSFLGETCPLFISSDNVSLSEVIIN